MDFTLETTITIPVKVRVHGYHPARPGRFSGPPENCFPDEPAEWDYCEYFIEVEGNKKLVKLPDEIEKIIAEDMDDEINERGEFKLAVDEEDALIRKAEDRREFLAETFRGMYP
jgi:hypothetical protein